MEAMRSTWTDERLDDGFGRVTAELRTLRGEVGSLRGETHTEFRSVRQEMKDEFAAVRQEMHADFGSLRQEMHGGFDGLNRTLLQVGRGIIASLLGGLVAVLGVLVTQL